MLIITTFHGHRYKIHPNSFIERTDMKFVPSDSWRLLGITHVNHSRRVISFSNIEKWLTTQPALRFKNGDPVWAVLDLDHNTIRQWGDRIISIYREA